MDLSSVNITLNDVQDGHVLSFSGRSADHDIVWMKQSSHNIQDSGFPDVRHLPFNGQRSVTSHEEMASGSWNQRGHQTNHIVVHVAWVS